MIPTARRDPFVDDDPTESLHVFVPGLMGAGVLLSVGIMITDALHRLRGGRGARRQAELVAWFAASDVVRSVHREAQLDPAVGLRRRVTYVVNAALFLGLGVYGLIGSFWNYMNPVDDGWVEGIAWVWALSFVVVAGLLSLGGVLAFIAWRHPNVPSWARRFLARTRWAWPHRRVPSWRRRYRGRCRRHAPHWSRAHREPTKCSAASSSEAPTRKLASTSVGQCAPKAIRVKATPPVMSTNNVVADQNTTTLPVSRYNAGTSNPNTMVAWMTWPLGNEASEVPISGSIGRGRATRTFSPTSARIPAATVNGSAMANARHSGHRAAAATRLTIATEVGEPASVIHRSTASNSSRRSASEIGRSRTSSQPCAKPAKAVRTTAPTAASDASSRLRSNTWEGRGSQAV